MGATIAANIRPADYCARFGGEEFVVVLVDCRRDEAVRIAERVRGAVEAADLGGVAPDLRVTVSLGLASAEEYDDALIEEADGALYRAKSEGRNRVVHAADGSGQELPEGVGGEGVAGAAEAGDGAGGHGGDDAGVAPRLT